MGIAELLIGQGNKVTLVSERGMTKKGSGTETKLALRNCAGTSHLSVSVRPSFLFVVVVTVLLLK